MTGNEIRKKFLDFFESKNHQIIKSDSLVPKDDPTVLFTTAGMQQFKRQFLGYIDKFAKASTSQKCLRTDDLDKVGVTDCHHTFFEMLGNFSFGDYFKKEAIEWAWEFLTEELKLDKKKLWVSVYKDDAEAEDIWLNHIKFPKERLVKLGDHSNFWPADAKEKGPNGPCGPCSEIFYDYGVNPDCENKACDPSCDCGRFTEIWNLVFTQFERKEGGVLAPLPKKNIDTGMGLERLTAVLQGKKNNFDTDLFAPIIKSIETIINQEKIEIPLNEKRMLADHIRAITFGIHDGIIPSNKERGYVIKGLINKCANILLSKGTEKPLVYKFAAAVVDAMEIPYPELKSKKDDIESIIKKSEEAFISVRKQRLPELENIIKSLKTPEELGEQFFIFHDTYGLPVKAGIDAARNIKTPISIDSALKIYQQKMDEQKERSRASSKMAGDVFADKSLNLNVPKTNFIGYEISQSTSTILALFINDEKINNIKKGTDVKIILDRTPFYAESGGQIGDTGYIISKNGKVKINDTHKISDIFIHVGTVIEGEMNINDQVIAEIDIERRLAIMRNHTATHLLQSALRQIVGGHVQQQGSYVSDERLRFDFSHHKALTNEELKNVEKCVNQMILSCETITKEFLSMKEAQDTGALAFFAEKYGDVVRVVSIDNYSKELCGGTHLDSTGQIGLFKIISESAIAQGIRRIEAITGLNALTFINEQERRLTEIAGILKSPLSEIKERADLFMKKIKELEKEVDTFRFDIVKNSVDSIIESSLNINGVKIITHCFNDSDMNVLRKLSDLIKQKSKSSIIVLGAKTKESASLITVVTEDLAKKGIKANEIITKVALLIDGKGGGNPMLAQAGSKNISKIEDAVNQAADIIKGYLKS